MKKQLKILNLIDIPWNSALTSYAIAQAQALRKKGHIIYFGAVKDTLCYETIKKNNFQTIAVAVPVALNVNTLDELVALARKEPGKLNLAPTPGTTEITFDNFLKTAGITMTKIPYGDITKALTDLSENRVQVR